MIFGLNTHFGFEILLLNSMKTEGKEYSLKEDQYQEKSKEFQTYFQNLKDCMEGERPIQLFTEFFYKFVRHNPEKQNIKIIAKQARHKLMQSTKFREVIDSFIVITKLFKFWTTEGRSTSNHDNMFKQKIKVIETRLNKSELGEQLERIFTYFKRQWQFRKHFEKLLDQKRYLDEELEKIKQQRDSFKNIVFNVGRSLFGSFDLQQKTGNILTSEKIIQQITSIKQLKASIANQQQQVPKRRSNQSNDSNDQLIKKILIIKKKYELYGKTNIEILESFDAAYERLTKKNQELTKPLQKNWQVGNNDLSQLKKQNIQLKKQILAYIKSQKQLKDMVRQQKTEAQIIQSQALIERKLDLSEIYLQNSEIINEQNRNQSKFLFQNIESLIKMKPKNANILFTSRQNSSKNFHQSFDNIRNILLLVKLTNGNIIGGFSEDQFRPKCYGQKGFLFNLTKKEIYERVQKSTIVYGDYYLIFGNSEISIKTNEMRLYSNFGAANRHFNSKNRNAQFFLGEENSREVSMQIYEIYEIMVQ